ncbi:MAG: hypothetical protein BGO41_14195 [Clostridiales bacterium 38-18]|nr:MAG: hypothetical protein BGO41_14195 [Clostridiales bacterium 38-18]
MSFDGLLMQKLTLELKQSIEGGRIDKVFQPEKDELSLMIRGSAGNQQLFISVDASMPFFALIEEKKENPQAPPMFCMLMRKHLSGGKIQSINQLGYERILVIEIESKNELGDFELKKLIVEIMGKHSNIILTKADFTIIDSIKRITPDMSRVRSILPGLKYTFIPSDKIDFSENNDRLLEALFEHHSEQKLAKSLYMTIQGFSPLISSYICLKIGVDSDFIVSQLTEIHKIELKRQFDIIRAQHSNGYVYTDETGLSKMIYFLPDMRPDLKQIKFVTLSEALERFFLKSNREHKMHQKTLTLKKTLAQRIERYRAKLGKQELEKNDAENADQYKILGELILANLYTLEKGMNKAIVLNYYQDPAESIQIELDTRLEPTENAQAYFKKYNKLKKAAVELDHHIQETKLDVNYLEEVLTHLENSEDNKIIEDIKTELIEQGYIKGRVQKKKANAKVQYKTFTSHNGYEILVGKSSLQNDFLTTKFASNKDIWLHTKDIPGSHVIIRTEGSTPDEQTLYEAALIAAYYSKAKDSSNVPVDYTLIKHVSKPSGSKPGMVIYTHQRTLFVTPSYDAVHTLMNSALN